MGPRRRHQVPGALKGCGGAEPAAGLATAAAGSPGVGWLAAAAVAAVAGAGLYVNTIGLG